VVAGPEKGTRIPLIRISLNSHPTLFTLPESQPLSAIIEVKKMILSDNELISRSRNGDMYAFEELVCRYDRKVLGCIMNFVQSREEAQDLYQEVFLRAYRGLPKFRFESRFSTWLYRITANVCLSYRSSLPEGRWISIEREYSEAGRDDGEETLFHSVPEELTSPPDSFRETYRGQIARRIEKALRSLSGRQRLVFVLRHYEGCRLREIASILSCAEGTVKKHLFSATLRMKEELRELYIQR